MSDWEIFTHFVTWAIGAGMGCLVALVAAIKVMREQQGGRSDE